MVARFGIVPAAWLDHEEIGIAELAVLAALSTYANKQGYAFPSQDRIARQLGRSQPWVSAITRKLADLGFLEARPRKDNARAYEYRIMYDRIDQPADVNDQPADLFDQPADTNNTKNTTINTSKGRPRSRTTMDEDWRPRETDTLAALAKYPLLKEENMADEADRFRDHWLGKGDTKADWNAAWRNWLGNAARFADRDNIRPARSRRAAPDPVERRRRITAAAVAVDDQTVIDH